MANNDTRQYLQDALLRYDPNIDLSEGSRADTELVQPIMQRIGIDPFDDDILTFVTTRVRQAFPNLAITEADDLTDMVIDPMRVLIEAVVREIKLVKLRSSLRNINSLADDEVDALLANFFLPRISGGYAVGVVRAYFSTPQSLSLALTNPATTKSGLRFRPTRPQAITADQMILNRDGSEYYFDINYTAEFRGDEYNVEAGEIVSIANLPVATRVKNTRRFRGGVARETSVAYAARSQSSMSDKTLVVDRGIVSTLKESFPDIRRLFSVGFRDPEMQRDIIRGGSLGAIPDDDLDGHFYGTGTAVDDLDGDLTTPIFTATGGAFVSRLGAAGSEPEGWYVTITYTDGDMVMVDAKVVEVLSASSIVIDVELPVLSPALSLTWSLRRRELTISDIPGGITLPDSADGTLEIRTDEVHIGGKIDVYIAGATELATAQIESLTDEDPSARGFDAETQGLSAGLEDQVILNDSDGSGISTGFSLVLEEGVDANSYRILEIVTLTPVTLRIDTDLTGSQGSLSWKVVDEIDTELTDPKDVKVDGSDMVTAAGNPLVTTSSATNFLDANVQQGDILELFDPDFGGEFTVEEVSAVSLLVTPEPARTFTSIAYRVFRRSEAVEPPLVRVSAMELLDSTGAPSGTKIPYRDPVLALSNSFQNEGAGFAFEGLCRTGLVTTGVPTTTAGFIVGSTSFDWETYDRDALWGDPLASGTMTFTAGAKTAAQVVTAINADATLSAAGVKAQVITKLGQDYVGLISSSLILVTSGTALTPLGWVINVTNAQLRSSNDNRFSDAGVRLGDAIEIVEGNSAGRVGRVVLSPIPFAPFDLLSMGRGPIGPEDTNGVTGLYNAVPLNPDVDVMIRIGRPSIGSARVYFLDPTSAEFDYRQTVFTANGTTATLRYIPDPENLRVVRPPPPTTELPHTGVAASGPPDTLTDTDANFLLYGILPGDLVDVLYVPIDGTATLPPSGDIAFTGVNNTLRISLSDGPFITISFPFPMPRADVVDFINEQAGEEIASLTSGGALRLQASHRIALDPTSTVITHGSNPLLLAGVASFANDHPEKGTYIVKSVAETVLTFSTKTPAMSPASSTPDTSYRIRRYLQRISPTEMNNQLEASGLYYADVQMLSLSPGDVFNIVAGEALEIEGVRSDGYRLLTDNATTTFSRAEVLNARFSRSILLVGSADDPSEAVQLSQQNVQVSYDRSQLVDEVQSFCDGDFQRVLCAETLVRHLLPHYVSYTWNYVGGGTEPDMLRATQETLDAVEPDEQLEVTDLTDVLRRRSATSVFTPDSASTTGRSAPFFTVVYHNEDREVRALIVKDYVTTVRTQRYISDKITLTRLTTGGIR